MQTPYECSILWLLPYCFQWLCFLTKKYLFYSAFQRESGKKKKYHNWLLLSLSVEKTVIIIKTSDILGQKNPNSCLLSVVCQYEYCLTSEHVLAGWRKVNILRYFRFAVPQNMKFGRILRKQNQCIAFFFWQMKAHF